MRSWWNAIIDGCCGKRVKKESFIQSEIGLSSQGTIYYAMHEQKEAEGDWVQLIIQAKLEGAHDAAILLLSRTDLKKIVKPEEILEILHTHRTHLDPQFITERLAANNLAIYKLALINSAHAIKILGSRLGNDMTAVQKMEIACRFSEDQDFQQRFHDCGQTFLIFIIQKSAAQRTSLEVINKLKQHVFLVLMLNLELQSVAREPYRYDPRDMNPSVFLNIKEGSSSEEIGKAFLMKIRKFDFADMNNETCNKLAQICKAHDILTSVEKLAAWKNAQANPDISDVKNGCRI